VKAIVVTNQAEGAAGMKLVERPTPKPAINEVIVEVEAAGFVNAELNWPATWVDRLGRDRTPSIPGREFAGVVSELGYGTTGLSIGQRVFGLADWYRDGALAEYVAVDVRNLAALPADDEMTVAASLPISGLTAWQGLVVHGRLQAGQRMIVHGAGGAVGSIVTQLARELGAYVIGTGRAGDHDAAIAAGANEFVDLERQRLEDVGEVDLIFDSLGGEIGKRSARLVRGGGVLISIVGPADERPTDARVIDFVVEPDQDQLEQIVKLVRDGRLRNTLAAVVSLEDAIPAFNAPDRRPGKTVIRIHA
jgi:NADPH:quinone reductase-like Zn-dependent oxidoreductase